jgi:hypothetical protein
VTSRTPDLPRAKSIGVFAAQAFLLSLLIGWWPTPRDLYPPFLRAQAGALVGGLSGGAVTLRAEEGAVDGVDTVMEEMPPGERAPRWRAELSLLRLGWWPSAVLAALMLATPMTGRRRALSMLAGFLWIELYVLLRLFAEIAYADREALSPGGPLTGPLHALLRTAAEVLEANVVLVAVVLLAWIAIARPARVLDARSLRRSLRVPG